MAGDMITARIFPAISFRGSFRARVGYCCTLKKRQQQSVATGQYSIMPTVIPHLLSPCEPKARCSGIEKPRLTLRVNRGSKRLPYLQFPPCNSRPLPSLRPGICISLSWLFPSLASCFDLKSSMIRPACSWVSLAFAM